MPARTLWARWKRFAHRAAEIQSFVVLTALYWIVVAPIGLLARKRRGVGGWRIREAGEPASIESARRQY